MLVFLCYIFCFVGFFWNCRHGVCKVVEMKKKKFDKFGLFELLFSVFFLCAMRVANAQQGFYAPNGGPFTPKGHLKMLIIYAMAKESCGSNDGWHSDSCSGIPSVHKELFYSDTSEFSTEAKDRTVSNYLFQMSNGLFKLTAVAFPEVLVVDAPKPTHYFDESDKAKKVYEQMQQLLTANKYPGFKLQDFDHRKNRPNFRRAQTDEESDGSIDYAMIVWRNEGVAGEASITNHTFQQDGKKFQLSDGFRCIGSGVSAEKIRLTFLHELAHSLFNAPHYTAENHFVTGNHFHANIGHSMLRFSYVNSTINAFERWYLGWAEIPEGKDLKSVDDNGVYRLGDFVTENDFLRIKIPHSDPPQHLWIENHKMISSFENRADYHSDNLGRVIPMHGPGLLIYLEGLSPNRNHPLQVFEDAGKFKSFHAAGNHDFVLNECKIEEAWWHNWVCDLKTLRENPTGPHHGLSLIRANLPYEKDTTKIVYTSDGNTRGGVAYNEGVQVLKLDGEWVFHSLGAGATFNKVGQKLGLSSNPVILPLQKYYPKKDSLQPANLNNLAIEVFQVHENGDISVKVSFDEGRIVKDQRFTGSLRLMPNFLEKPDLEIKPTVTLLIDKSGSANRSSKGKFVNGTFEFPDFVNPSELILEKDSFLKVHRKGLIQLKDNSTLVIKKGANVILHGEIWVEKGSKVLGMENLSPAQLKKIKLL